MSHRRKTDPAFKMMMACRTRIGTALRGKRRTSRSAQLVGCSPDELRAHIEKQFKPGMTWANHGTWHVDHIRPCASFNLLLREHQRQCFHFTNLQPLWSGDNHRKGARWKPEAEPLKAEQPKSGNWINGKRYPRWVKS